MKLNVPRTHFVCMDCLKDNQAVFVWEAGDIYLDRGEILLEKATKPWTEE